MVKDRSLTSPEVRGKLETLLKYIERGIPLNQLYVDLNNDEKIENDTEIEDTALASASTPRSRLRRASSLNFISLAI